MVRDEYYYLLQLQDKRQVERDAHELQFDPDWVDWDQALTELSFETEREWMRRARAATTLDQDL